MRTSYELSLNNINLSLGDVEFANETSNQETLVGIGNSVILFDIHNFSDRMSVDNYQSRNTKDGFSLETPTERILALFEYFPKLEDTNVGLGSTTPYVGYRTVKTALENVTKAMLIALLEDSAKRGNSVGIGSTSLKKNIFFNCLKQPEYRNNSIKPWNNWNETVGICTVVSIARSDNVATVVTNPAHGMSTSYDDWGVVMQINTGIATSFNISTSFYPNGVPIKIVSEDTFTYKNIGINTSTTIVTGTADIKVGWGGTSNNLHLVVF
jgi:hypothetical protein